MRESASTDLREPQGSNSLGPPGPELRTGRIAASCPESTANSPHTPSGAPTTSVRSRRWPTRKARRCSEIARAACAGEGKRDRLENRGHH